MASNSMPKLESLPNLDCFSQHTTVYIDPSRLEEFWEAFLPVYEKTSAVPECLYLEVFEHPDTPGKITWITNWNATPEWVLKEHAAKDYYAPYLAATEPLFTKPREIRMLKREPGFVAGKKANFEPQLGKDNTGQSFLVNVELKPECAGAFREEMAKVYATVAGGAECLYFEIFSEPGAPHKLSWLENWREDLAWLQKVQFTKELYKPYLAATEPMIGGAREFTFLKRKEGFVKGRDENFRGAPVGDFRE